MSEKPILFSAPMVRAILDGRKTMTRRIYKARGRYPYEDGEDTGNPGQASRWVEFGPCPYGQPGDRLWVRETWGKTLDTVLGGNGASYRATDDASEVIRWYPSIHMPRRVSRITLEITGVRVERLNAITAGDADAEGVDASSCCRVEAFERLWDGINAERGYSWASNPWVWVIEFKRIGGAQ